MAKGKRSVPEINSSSTADIAFLLLIFFLITTSMDTDRGLARRLPPPPEQDQKKDESDKVKERNILMVFLNYQDQLMVGPDYMDVSQLRERAKDFITNSTDDPTKPERVDKEIPLLGNMKITEKHVISLRCDRATSYKSYIAVQNELVAAYNELRDELAENEWHMKYSALDEEQQKAIREVYPQRISEAEPRKYGEKK
jgi:biopolymer transport protein ExbD